MDVTPLVPKGKKVIHAYGDGGFRIGEERHEGAMIVTPDSVLAWDANGNALTEAGFAQVLALSPAPEILLIGTGKTALPLPPPLRAAFRAKGIAADAMDTGAACRTYNVLLGEGRVVAAALIAV